jgi:hypothetical protein
MKIVLRLFKIQVLFFLSSKISFEAAQSISIARNLAKRAISRTVCEIARIPTAALDCRAAPRGPCLCSYACLLPSPVVVSLAGAGASPRRRGHSACHVGRPDELAAGSGPAGDESPGTPGNREDPLSMSALPTDSERMWSPDPARSSSERPGAVRSASIVAAGGWAQDSADGRGNGSGGHRSPSTAADTVCRITFVPDSQLPSCCDPSSASPSRSGAFPSPSDSHAPPLPCRRSDCGRRGDRSAVAPHCSASPSLPFQPLAAASVVPSPRTSIQPRRSAPSPHPRTRMTQHSPVRSAGNADMPSRMARKKQRLHLR